ncbi:MAG TPA: hypothetical protein VMK83_11345 [Gaiellaceae bacterium]|nr:hypothetical protein [Gaiellaceae bacterium]
MSLPRVIAKQAHDAAFLIETRARNDRRYGCIYDARRDELFLEMLVASIAARGYWDEVEPSDYAALVERLSTRLTDVRPAS